MKNPKISVVIPSFNQGRYIEDTITSVLDQGYPNIELFVFDGGSTDTTVEVLKKYDRHLTFWVSEKDRGQTDAINKGLRRATGEVFAYLNSDDFFLPNALPYIAQAYQAYPEAGLYTGNGLIVDGRKENPRAYMRAIGYTYDSLLRGSCYLLQPSTFINRKAWEKTGEFDDTLRFAMDLDYWLRVGRDFAVVLLNEPLSAWRMHEEIKTSNGGMVRWNELWRLYRKFTKDQITPGLLVELFSVLQNPLISEQLGMDIRPMAGQCFNKLYTEMQKTLNLQDCIPVGQGTVFQPVKSEGVAPEFRAYPPSAARLSPGAGKEFFPVPAEQNPLSSVSAPAILKAPGHQRRVDIVLQATGQHAWAVGGGWENAARQLGFHHRTFRPRAQWGASELQTDDGLFAALADPQADILFLAGFDWHSQVLHASPRWRERWQQCPARKILYAQESVLNHEKLSGSKVMETAFRRAAELVDAIVYTDISDRPLMNAIGKPVLFQPFGVDETIFSRQTPFTGRLARAFFRGKHQPFAGQASSYLDRRALIQFLLDHQALDMVPYQEKPVTPQDLAADFNRFRVSVNFPSVFSNHPTRIYEAMACGCAVITNRTGTEEIDRQFEHGRHLLYYSNREELLEAVRTLTTHPELPSQIAEQGWLLVREKHALHRRLAQAVEWLDTIPKKQCARIPVKISAGPATPDSRQTIVVDGVIFDLQRHGLHGISRVWLRLLEQLAKTPLASRIVLLDRDGTAPAIEGIRRRKVPAFDFRHFEDDSIRVQQWCNEENARLFVSTYHTCAENIPNMIVLHDMIPEITGQDLSQSEWRAKAKAIARACAYLAVSQSTANDFRRLYPQYASRPLTLAHNAVGDELTPASASAIEAFKQKHKIQKPFFLLVGNRMLYKNAMLFFRAFGLLAERDQLEVICLGGGRELESAFKPFARGASCRVLRVSDEELAAAYGGAEALVYPSQYEGFGLPILEAQKCACPIITCRNSSIPEVAGDAVLYVGESDVNGMSQALVEVRRPETRRRLLEAGRQNFTRFSWESTGKIVTDTFEQTWRAAATLPRSPTDPIETSRKLIFALSTGNETERQLAAQVTVVIGQYCGTRKYDRKSVTEAESLAAGCLASLWPTLEPRLANSDEWDPMLAFLAGLKAEAQQDWGRASALYTRLGQSDYNEVLGVFHVRVGLRLAHIVERMGNAALAQQVITQVVQPWLRGSRGTIDLEAEQASLKNWAANIPAPKAAASLSPPLVSAIVSTYKSERFLRGCLEDLERQTIADRLEIIVVDSNSPQNERAIVEEFQKRYSNIVYIRSQERETVYGAWNRGIRAARGKYVTNANTDDRHRGDALEILARTLDQHGDITLVYADCLITPIENETMETTQARRRFQWLEFNPQDLWTKGCFCGPQPMWRRAAHDEHGYFDAGMVSAGDYEFWLRLAQNRKFLHVAEPLGLYLESPSSVEHANRDIGAKEVKLARERYQGSIMAGKPVFRPKLAEPVAAADLVIRAGGKPPAVPTPVPVALPRVAQVGQLHEARELLAGKKPEAAWQSANTAISQRPFHPEAFLLLAEIAVAAGDGAMARKCAQQARDLAPGWDPAKRFLKQSLKAGATPKWLTAPVQIQKTTPADKLSVCLIVKNEEQFIGQCLKSMRDIASQIILVDTGSTDRTVEIAKEFGAEVSCLPWADDFAAARNAALQAATGDWILMLDADEELPAAQHNKLIADMKNPLVVGYRLPLVNLGQEAEGCSYVPRLFRNAPGIYYSGRIHEQVFPSLIPLCHAWGIRTALGSPQLLHHGYSKELVRDRNKVERNLKLLKLALAENPGDVNLVMNFGMELVRAGDLNAGIVHYREAFEMMSVQTPQQVVPELREVLLTQFTSQLYKIRGHAEVVQVLNSPLAKNGELTASLHLALGLSCFELNDYGLAAEHMKQCLAKRDKPCLSPINVDIHGAAPNHCLALCLSRMNDVAGAEKAFQAAEAVAGAAEAVKLDYAKFLSDGKRPVEALQKLNEIVAANVKHARAWKAGGEIALSSAEFLDFACDWTGEAARALPEDAAIAGQRAEALMLHGDAAGAAKIWQRLVAMHPDVRQEAALILCELAADTPVHKLEGETDELSVTRCFIEWYQRLIGVHANSVVKNVNDRLEKLSQVLPTAAQMIGEALAETSDCVPA